MNYLITGTSKLSGALHQRIESSHNITSTRVEGEIEWDNFDVFLNCAHVGFEQSYLLYESYLQWKDNPKKLIINFSSRAHKPNITKGLLYGAQKASLNHMCDNIVYNTDCECGVVVLNLGLLEDSLPSTSYEEVCDLVDNIVTDFYNGNSIMTEVTLQNKYNYTMLQKRKEERYK
jgi:hypothetical protein